MSSVLKPSGSVPRRVYLAIVSSAVSSLEKLLGFHCMVSERCQLLMLWMMPCLYKCAIDFFTSVHDLGLDPFCRSPPLLLELIVGLFICLFSPPFPFAFLDEKLPLISGTRMFLPAFGVYLYTDLRTATVWFASVMNLRYFRSADMFREEKVLET